MAYTITEVKNNIKYNEDLIKSYQSSIKELKEQISELTVLKGKLQSFQKDFSNREANRKKKIAKGFAGLNFKFLTAYIKGMSNLISGSEYKKAYNGLSEAIRKVDKKIISIREEINDCNKKIEYNRIRVRHWENQLKNLQMEEIRERQ